ncbi:MAG TPA: response regulator, partial [Acidobacteriota bacterium]|nr:response regulator [Acidobacteriota bacterium]
MTHNKILIVDDEKRQREILELILTSEGYRANVAASGEAALRMVKNEHFDLVLTDLKMGGMSGLELMKNLTQLDSSIIVILMTAHGSIDSAKEAIRHGAFDYLEKPLDQVRLLAVISQALGRLNTLDGEIIGQSEQMERLKKLILKV